MRGRNGCVRLCLCFEVPVKERDAALVCHPQLLGNEAEEVLVVTHQQDSTCWVRGRERVSVCVRERCLVFTRS